jgi:glyoxylase-like metal-dependent hydrolase (beta-lactamase superfamily II)
MEVLPGIHEIHGRASNCYLVVDDEVMLIDTGMPGNSSKILGYLENTLNENPSQIKIIVITHHHFDHTGSLDKIKKATGAKIAIHSADAEYIMGDKSQSGPKFMNTMVKLLKIIYRTKSVVPDILLEDGDLIGKFRVIHTPGHTPGSICLFNPKNKVIFVSDNLIYSEGKIKGPIARLLPDPVKYKESMKKLAELDIEVILTGHSTPVTSGGGALLDEYLKKL